MFLGIFTPKLLFVAQNEYTSQTVILMDLVLLLDLPIHTFVQNKARYTFQTRSYIS